MDDINNNNHTHEHGEDCCCGHDHDHDHEHEVQYMTLSLEDGSEVRCAVVGIFEVEEYEGKEYIALVPEDGEEAYIYEYVETEGEDGFELKNIESDEEFDTVESSFMEMLDDDDWDEEYDEEYDDEDEYEYEDLDDEDE